MTESMRLQRALARAGVASRRAAEALIAAGRVRVNGAVAGIGQSVRPGVDAITVDGAPVAAPAAAKWFALHKPAGTITSRADPQKRPTVFSLVPSEPGLTYVGRLDYLTEGLLLFTTDGAAAHRLTHPSAGIERTYVATVKGDVRAAVRRLRAGLTLADGPVEARDVSVAPAVNRCWNLELTLTEGRNREVRRVCEALGLDVQRLVRTRFGPVSLGRLPRGACRPLSDRELRLLAAL
ncbi:MAG TPA: pseudouridine synthase [Gemmatimonadaceae bacterium]|nr:pseudouridine synthase [Gemmatimonadaceae bacterium]